MDALRAWMRSDLDVIMVGTWMLCGHRCGVIWKLSWLGHCGHGWGLIWTLFDHGWHMDALRAWMGSDLDGRAGGRAGSTPSTEGGS